MKQKFSIGDKVAVHNVRDASAVGYLGSFRQVVSVKHTDNEYLYCTKSIYGDGFTWFYADELILNKRNK